MRTEPIKVLIVDDIPENLVALEALLRRDDISILKARSGAEALELLLVHEISLALLDVQMPNMDGFELAELMRGHERTRSVPIIFVTAGTRDPKRVFKGYERGAVDFLFKPIDAHILASKVDAFIALARERQLLAQSLKLNEMFVGILGHDLRNPLAAVVTGSEILINTLTNERHLDILRKMNLAGRRMAEMIDQLLDLTRARLGDGLGLIGNRTRVDLGELLQRTIDELRVTTDREIVRAMEAPCATDGDPERLVQMFSNLIANAVQHSTPGSRITASVRCEGGDVVVEIHNAGMIPPDVLPTVFEPFRTTRKSGGLGLGLYIAKQIANAHGGDITVRSTEAAGTVFAVRLRRAVAQ